MIVESFVTVFLDDKRVLREEWFLHQHQVPTAPGKFLAVKTSKESVSIFFNTGNAAMFLGQFNLRVYLHDLASKSV